jgi:hypothetical protein
MTEPLGQMATRPKIDEGRPFDWGQTSPDYAVSPLWLHAYTPIGDADMDAVA